MDNQRRTPHNLVSAWLLLGWAYLSTRLRFFYWRHTLIKHSGRVESKQASMKQTLLLIRHGQTTWNVEHRLPGHLAGVSLNDTGRAQAERLSKALLPVPISAVISSPLERALCTAEYLVLERSLEIGTDPDLMDTEVGPWAGRTIDDVNKNDPAWKEYLKNPMVAPEGIETFPQVQQRALAAVERWLAQADRGAYPAIVSHDDVTKLLLAHYMGLDVRQAGTLRIENASVSLVELEPGRPAHILAVSWTPQPGWLKLPIAEPVTSIAAEQHE
jgi:Fructose-2,6-bisphosphatase